MRTSPFPSLKTTGRIFIKAAILLVIFNFACVAANFDPIGAITTFNSWWLVGHGRPRLSYPSDFVNGQLPVEALVGAHALAYTPKAVDEYRVVVLGESGIAGWGLPDEDTFSAQLTARGIQIGNKRLVAYNLAYPSPSVARDVLVLDEALRYQPDLVIWCITAASVDNSINPAGVNNVFFDLNQARLARLTDEFGLQTWYNQRFEPLARSWLAIQGQDKIPVWLNSLLYPFVAPDLGLSPLRIGKEPVPAKVLYQAGNPGFTHMPNDTWRFLLVGRDLAAQHGAPLLLINEPMVIGFGPNSTVNYNSEYERSLYDAYRSTLSTYAQKNGLWYADLWNIIPAANFRDTPLHADAAGYALLVDHVVEQIQKTEIRLIQ